MRLISFILPSMEKQWFESWFDTPYYHLLYKNRDDKEAQQFLDLILTKIPISPPDSILDLACGKGRHAIYLAEKGFTVTGYDLSPANIEAASRFSHERLHFEIRDMRENLGNGEFDAVFNLFTGFGYFASDEENFNVFANIKRALKKDGYFLFDYLNESYVRNLHVMDNTFEIEGVKFRTHKNFEGRWVIKNIEVADGEQKFYYKEKVAMYAQHEIVDKLQTLNLEVISTFGNYKLDDYTLQSPRLILLCRVKK